MKKQILALLLPLIIATSAHADGKAAVMHMAGGLSMMIMDHAVTCSGGPTAVVFDPAGKIRDQTCNVQINADGVRTTFAGYGKPVFWRQDQFEVIDVPGQPSAAKPDPHTRALMAREEKLNDQCRGGSGDSPATQKACDARDDTMAAIRARHWCWGHRDDIGSDRTWVQCQPGD